MDGHETKKLVPIANNGRSFEHKLDFSPGPDFYPDSLELWPPTTDRLVFFVPSSAVHLHPDDRSVLLTFNQTPLIQVKFYLDKDSRLTKNIFFIFFLFSSIHIHYLAYTNIFPRFRIWDSQIFDVKYKKCLIFSKCRFQVDRFMFIISEINDWRTKRTKTIPNWLKGIHFSFIKPTDEIKNEL